MPRQLAFDLARDPALDRDSFITSPANAPALAAIDDWESWPAGRMVLIGPPGAGKTHLAHIWAAMAGARLIKALDLTAKALPDLAETALAIEGADHVAGNRAAETTLFHLYNLAAERGIPLLLTARTPPARWDLVLPDLASRLASLPVTRLAPPDDALLTAVLEKQFADRQLKVPDTLIPYVLTRMERSFSAARQLVADLDARALADGRPISRARAANVLGPWPGKAAHRPGESPERAMGAAPPDHGAKPRHGVSPQGHLPHSPFKGCVTIDPGFEL